MTAWLALELERRPRLAVLGDLNIAPEPRDVHDPKRWEGKIHFSEPERAAFRDVLKVGLRDAFRLFNQPEKQFTWWDYRLNAFQRGWGLRIDHVLLSPELAAACKACGIDTEPRKRERPSDHAPVIRRALESGGVSWGEMRVRMRRLLLFGALAAIVGYLLLDQPARSPGLAVAETERPAAAKRSGRAPRAAGAPEPIRHAGRALPYASAAGAGEEIGAGAGRRSAGRTPVPYRFAGKVRKGSEEEVLIARGS